MIMFNPLSFANTRSTARRSASSKSKLIGWPVYCFWPVPGRPSEGLRLRLRRRGAAAAAAAAPAAAPARAPAAAPAAAWRRRGAGRGGGAGRLRHRRGRRRSASSAVIGSFGVIDVGVGDGLRQRRSCRPRRPPCRRGVGGGRRRHHDRAAGLASFEHDGEVAAVGAGPLDVIGGRRRDLHHDARRRAARGCSARRGPASRTRCRRRCAPRRPAARSGNRARAGAADRRIRSATTGSGGRCRPA